MSAPKFKKSRLVETKRTFLELQKLGEKLGNKLGNPLGHTYQKIGAQIGSRLHENWVTHMKLGHMYYNSATMRTNKFRAVVRKNLAFNSPCRSVHICLTWDLGHTSEIGSHLENWVTCKNGSHRTIGSHKKIGSHRKIGSHVQNWVTSEKMGHMTKMGHTPKIGSHVQNLVTRPKIGSRKQIGPHEQNGSRVPNWVTSKKNGHTKRLGHMPQIRSHIRIELGRRVRIQFAGHVIQT